MEFLTEVDGSYSKFPLVVLHSHFIPIYGYLILHSQFPLVVCFTYGNVCFHVTLRELKPGRDNNLVGWDQEDRGRGVQMGGDVGKPMADSC